MKSDAPATTRAAPPTLDERLRATLDQLLAADLYRRRRCVEGTHGVGLRVDGVDCVNFCSNDYLGLGADPRLTQAASRAMQTVGTGSGAAALICGYNREHQQLEEALAGFTGYPRALLFSSGWAANVGVLRALLGREDLLIADELNHASLIDGGRLSGARYVRIPHRDVPGFERALIDERAAAADTALRVVVTDGVFSMDGDLAPLPALVALCREQGAALMVDDAHGFGVLGPHGVGACEQLGVRPDIFVATLGKALGCAGAFVAGSETLIETLIQRARSWVFSTAPPPALAAAAREALRIVIAEPERRARLHANIARFRSGAGQLGLRLGSMGAAMLPEGAASSDRVALGSPIQPIVMGDASRTMAVSRALFERGFLVTGIRPPSVPPGTSRLRVTLSAAHEAEQIDRLLDALKLCLPARD